MIQRGSMASRFLANPLLHFLVIGSVIFGLYESVPSRAVEVPKQIVIDKYELRRLAALWQGQWRRPPTADEFSQLVEDRVREEVFYRAALELGLDQNDVLVRRRLSEKLEVALSNVAAPATFSEDELYEYYQKNSSSYQTPVEITLEHRFYSFDHSDSLERANAAVANNAVPDDDPFHAPKRLELQSRERLERIFGNGMVEAVLDQLQSDGMLNQWFGPIPSAFGMHAVKVIEYHAAELLPFADVKQRVSEELRRDYVARASDDRYKQMLNSYKVEVAPLSSVLDLIAE